MRAWKSEIDISILPQNKTIESVLRWNRKGECLFWVFISCRKLPSSVMSLTVDSQNGLQNSSRKIYYQEKKRTVSVYLYFVNLLERKWKRRMKYPIQHFQGKQSKSETHKYFKRGSFKQKLSRNQVFITEKSNKHVH